MTEAKSELLRGTLDLLVLKVVTLGPSHGYAIAQRLQQISKDFFQVHQGSLYPALHRLEDRGWLQAEWNGKNPRPDAKPSSTRSPRRAADKWKPKLPIGSACATPSPWSSARRKRSGDHALAPPPVAEISRRERTRSRASLPHRATNRRLHRGRYRARRSPASRPTRIRRPRARQRRSPRHPLGNSPR